jgi:hypothetical protein
MRLSWAAKRETCHVAKRLRRITGTGGHDKVPVIGILERGGKIRTAVIPNRKKKALQAENRSRYLFILEDISSLTEWLYAANNGEGPHAGRRRQEQGVRSRG